MRMFTITACSIFALILASGQAIQAEKPAKDSKLISSEKLLGSYIYDHNNNVLATIDTITLNKQGDAEFVIARVGGVAGIGQRMIAVPCKALECRVTNDNNNNVTVTTMMAMTEENLKNAPDLKAKNYVELTDKGWLTKNAEFYNLKAPDVQKAESAVCVKSVTDTTIKGSTGESVGQLEAVILDMNNQEACYAIVGSGNTGGIGEKYHVLPFKALTITHDNERNFHVSVNATQAQINSAPEVTPSDYPELKLDAVRDSIDKMEFTKKTVQK